MWPRGQGIRIGDSIRCRAGMSLSRGGRGGLEPTTPQMKLAEGCDNSTPAKTHRGLLPRAGVCGTHNCLQLTTGPSSLVDKTGDGVHIAFV